MTYFLGYEREDGGVGVRNHLLIMPSVTCSSHVAREISDKVPGSVTFENQYGCGQLGEDFQQTFRTFVGLGTNPNVGAVLLVGLGCELLRPEKLKEEIASSGRPVETLFIQDSGGTTKTIQRGIELAHMLLHKISKLVPAEYSLEKLVLGLECGGSDSTSGLAANPTLGYAVDRLVEEGGSAILTEVPEAIGAEHLLAGRGASEEISQGIIAMVHAIEKEAVSQGVDIRGTQPTPGNIEGGLTTIEEKSLGCIYKSGTTAIRGLLQYGEKIINSGVSFMNGPGQDVQSIIGLLASGAQVIAFTTGRGNPVGSPIAPVVKITANKSVYEKMSENIDLYVGEMLYGSSSLEEEGARVYQEILEVCRGKLTRSEVLKHREFGVWRLAFTI